MDKTTKDIGNIIINLAAMISLPSGFIGVWIVLISRGGATAYFGYLLALVLLWVVVRFGTYLFNLGPMITILLIILNVSIVLISMGGYAAYFGYVLALVFIGMVGLLEVLLKWMVILAKHSDPYG